MLKLLKIIIISSIVSINSSAHSIDTLVLFANVNEGLFWDIISKNYPFTHDEIQKYKDDINFYYLSSNENINWTSEFINKYETSLSKTYNLQRNKGIKWNESMISEFLDRDWLDWSELYFNRKLTISKKLFEKEKRKFITEKFKIKETNDSLTFYYQHEYFTKERVFQNYLRNWYKESDSTRVINFKNLKQYFGKEISSVPVDTIIKYMKEINWNDFTRFAELPWTWKSLSFLFPYLEERYIPYNKFLYNRLFKPELNSVLLSQLFEQFQKKTRLFKIREGEDKYGYPPSINVRKDNYLNFVKLGDEFDFDKSFPDSLGNYYFEIDHSAEVPRRFLDIMFLSDDYGFPSFICSKKVKYILDNYNLPKHRFYPIEITLDSYWYGKDTASYFLFIANNSSLIKNLMIESIKFKDSRNLLNEFDIIIPDSLKINTLSQFKKFIDSHYHFKNYKFKELSQLSLKSYYDLITINGENIYVSKRLMKTLVKANINGIKYQKDYSLNWSFELAEKKSINSVFLEESLDTFRNKKQKTIKLFDQAKEKQKKLSKNWEHVSKLYANIDARKLDSIQSQLMSLEIKWDVIIPEKYREYILANKKPKLGFGFREYEFLPLNRIEQVGKEWYEMIPQTYKAILIAENGLGDYLGFLLERKSSYQLSNTIFKFEHEEGKVIGSIKLK